MEKMMSKNPSHSHQSITPEMLGTLFSDVTGGAQLPATRQKSVDQKANWLQLNESLRIFGDFNEVKQLVDKRQTQQFSLDDILLFRYIAHQFHQETTRSELVKWLERTYPKNLLKQAIATFFEKAEINLYDVIKRDDLPYVVVFFRSQFFTEQYFNDLSDSSKGFHETIAQKALESLESANPEHALHCYRMMLKAQNVGEQEIKKSVSQKRQRILQKYGVKFLSAVVLIAALSAVVFLNVPMWLAITTVAVSVFFVCINTDFRSINGVINYKPNDHFQYQNQSVGSIVLGYFGKLKEWIMGSFKSPPKGDNKKSSKDLKHPVLPSAVTLQDAKTLDQCRVVKMKK